MNQSRPRKIVHLSEPLLHHLNVYALGATAAGVGLLASVQPAQAKIVYTHAHHKLPIDQDFYIDLNHDGTNDLRFRANQKYGSHESDTQSSYASLVVYPGQGNRVVGNTFSVSALNAGARIGPKARFNNRNRIGMGGVQTQSGGGPNYWGQWANGGKGVEDRYVGVEFLIKGKVHFGWARFNVQFPYGQAGYNVDAVVTGYAYETVANKAIVAGKTKGADVVAVQPASLGHLARGASAIPAWRVKQVAATTH